MNTKIIIVTVILCIVNISLTDDSLNIQDHDIAMQNDASIYTKVTEASENKTVVHEEQIQRFSPEKDRCIIAIYYEYEANTFKKSGNTEKAIELFNRAADLYEQIARYDKAIELYEKAIELYESNGNHGAANLMRARIDSLQKEL